MANDRSCDFGKDSSLFTKGQMIGMLKAEETDKEIEETTKIDQNCPTQH